jgi:hypothetical protein
MAPTSAETCAALCDDIAAKVHPDFDLLFEHGADVESTADAMLARLDELGAMLGTLRAEGREQREALEPVLEAFARGLARDFAYIDSVEDTVAAVRGAVATMETQLAALESSTFRAARVADVEMARRGIQSLVRRAAAATAELGANLERAGGSLVGNIASGIQRTSSGAPAAGQQQTPEETAAAAAAAAAADPASVSGRARDPAEARTPASASPADAPHPPAALAALSRRRGILPSSSSGQPASPGGGDDDDDDDAYWDKDDAAAEEEEDSRGGFGVVETLSGMTEGLFGATLGFAGAGGAVERSEERPGEPKGNIPTR